MIVRREPPERPWGPEEARYWVRDCLSDLAAGRHATGCECVDDWTSGGYNILPSHMHGGPGPYCVPHNACLAIAVCARDGKAYEMEVNAPLPVDCSDNPE